MSINITSDFSEVEAFFKQVAKVPTSRASLTRLGHLVAKEQKGYIDKGGTQGKQDGNAWKPTHDKWKKLRDSTSPLKATGHFQAGITFQLLHGAVMVGGSDGPTGTSRAGAWRFHHGDKKSYRWGAFVVDGKIVDAVAQPLGGVTEAVGGQFKFFSPRMQARPIWVVFQEDVDAWWKVEGKFLEN